MTPTRICQLLSLISIQAVQERPYLAAQETRVQLISLAAVYNLTVTY